MARHVGRSKPGLKPIQLYVRLNLRPLGQQAYHVWLREFLRYYVVTAAAVYLHFYTLSATRVLNSFEELCIMRAAAENSFTRVLNPHGGAYILSSTHTHTPSIFDYLYISNMGELSVSRKWNWQFLGITVSLLHSCPWERYESICSLPSYG